MAILFWLKRPRLLAARLRYWHWTKLNSDKPWMCPGTIAFCQANLKPSMKALEFGSGRSTRWFASLVGHLTSVEHHRGWYEQVKRQLADAAVKNVDYRHVALNHPISEPEQPEYDPVPAYVQIADTFADCTLDFVVVDGHYRTNCIRHVLPKIAGGGYLLIDDVNLWPSVKDLQIPASWRVADDSTNGIKRCVIFQAPATDVSG